MLALDINDAGIVAFDGREVRYREPGYALLDDGELTTGDRAWRQARLRPRHIQDHFWSRLDAEALPDQRFRHLSAADLVSRQLEQVAAAAGPGIEQVVVAVPAYMEAGNLGLFLGICNELGLPVIALVDAAVAATRREYDGAVPVHVDISLHSALLTRLGQPGKVQVEKADVVDAAGIAVLNDAWVRVISEAFVRQSRFDPLHTAETEQLLLEEEGQPATVEQGHAAIRYVNPTTGGDVMPTIRCEFHRLRAGCETPTRREVGSTVFQVFEGSGSVVMSGVEHKLDIGDMFVIPSWIPWSLQAETQFDLFRFSDAPIMERLHFARTHVEASGR